MVNIISWFCHLLIDCAFFPWMCPFNSVVSLSVELDNLAFDQL